MIQPVYINMLKPIQTYFVKTLSNYKHVYHNKCTDPCSSGQGRVGGTCEQENGQSEAILDAKFLE
jgi:hypothetical protein